MVLFENEGRSEFIVRCITVCLKCSGFKSWRSLLVVCVCVCVFKCIFKIGMPDQLPVPGNFQEGDGSWGGEGDCCSGRQKCIICLLDALYRNTIFSSCTWGSSLFTGRSLTQKKCTFFRRLSKSYEKADCLGKSFGGRDEQNCCFRS